MVRVKRVDSLLIAGLAIALTAGTCDRYYGLRRSVPLGTAPPDSNCVTEASLGAGVGMVSHRFDTSPDTGELTDYFRINNDSMHEAVTLAIPRGPSATAEASLFWGQLNRQPTAEQTARIRTIMDKAYEAAQRQCPGLPKATALKEKCDWCD